MNPRLLAVHFKEHLQVSLTRPGDPCPDRRMASPTHGKTIAQKLLASDDYQEWLRYRISTKTLDERIEVLLWQYAYGKPESEVTITNLPDLSNKTPHELLQELATLEKVLSQTTDTVQ